MTISHADKLNLIRRFYKSVETRPEAGGFAVALDGRTARTAGRAPLVVPTPALADLLAKEWDAQTELVDFGEMPATRLAFTVIDRGEAARAGLAKEVARYASTDLLSYPAEQPQTLVDRQAAAWGPWRAWAAETLGAPLVTAGDAVHMAQPPETLRRIEAAAAALDDFSLTGLVFAAALYGSAVLALAVQRGALDAAQAFELSRLEEAFQAEQWGLDSEAEARIERLRTEAATIGAWFAALR